MSSQAHRHRHTPSPLRGTPPNLGGEPVTPLPLNAAAHSPSKLEGVAFRPGAYVHPAKLNPLHLLFLIVLLLPLQGTAQTDTAFWFAVPDLSHGYGNVQTRLVFHTYDQPAIVTVEQPAGTFFPTTTFLMLANEVTTVGLSSLWSLVETAPVNTVLDKGLYIHSTAPVTCYFQSISNDRETYTLKGRNALGTDFQILTPLQYPHNHRRHDIGHSIEIVSTEDSNRIDVENFPFEPDTVLQGGILRDTTFQIVLNRGQSYAVRGNHYSSTVNKTRLHAIHPIAVNITSDSLMTRQQTDPSGIVIRGTCNLGGEQLLPNRCWGTEYVEVNNLTTTEMFSSTSVVDTGRYRVLVNGQLPQTMNGDFVWNVGWPNWHDSVKYLKSDRPIGVVHQTDPNRQMGFTVLPQIRCAGSHIVSYLRSDTMPITVHMVVESHAVGDILFNGDSTILTPAVFRPVPGLPTHRWCNVDVSRHLDSGEVMTISCATSKFLLAVIESDSARGTAYSYLTDYTPYIYLNPDMDTAYCTGDSIVFRYEGETIDSMAVHGPGGILLTAPPYALPDADTTMSGLYVIEGFGANGCSMTDSVRITVYPAFRTDTCDTIVENQLPWNRFGIDFLDEADTLIMLHADHCDSIYRYHLTVYPNIFDSAIFFLCPNAIPYRLNDSIFIGRDTAVLYFGAHGEDSTVTYRVILLHDSDTSITDTILESQLPWMFRDTLFTDSVRDFPIILVNEAGCDSVIHYRLFVFWDGDHCDTSLTFPTLVTPNGDGVNDRFVIGGLLENNCFRFNDLLIYDRTGQLVYHGHNIARDEDFWDPAAHRAPDATYFYVFKAHGVTIHTMHQGAIEVLR